MIPNILTLLALACGLTSMRFAFQERWEYAILAILVAAVFDALDGRIARMLKGTSKFGAELDSLSDFVCFGVAPGMILYLWAMHDAGRVGWLLVMLFAMCCGLRLARFNVALEEESKPLWKSNFFAGVPAPAGGGLVLLPMILAFQLGDDMLRTPWFVSIFLLGVAGLFVSTIPTYSFKKLVVPRRRLLAAMLGAVMVIAFIESYPWLSLSIFLFGYLGLIPFSLKAYKRYESGEEIDENIDEGGEDLEPL
tara:strand:+ start:75 stop:827 length:753 start_codon:yes stop_codon:yes gene_type:complete